MLFTITDQLGRLLSFKSHPKRIICLNPSQTETLVDLGLEENIVGVTKFCVHPKHLRKNKIIVGGTKKVSFEKIRQLQPDIILCNKEENTKEIVDTLAKEFPVHVTDVETITDALEMIKQYGTLFNKETQAVTMCNSITNELKKFRKTTEKLTTKKVAYCIWKDPWMVVGGGTFIDHMLGLNNYENNYKKQERYPMVTLNDLKEASLDYIFLSSEPFPFAEKHKKELKDLFPNVKIKLIDGEYFSWYGSRLLKAFSYFTNLIKNNN